MLDMAYLVRIQQTTAYYNKIRITNIPSVCVWIILFIVWTRISPDTSGGTWVIQFGHRCTSYQYSQYLVMALILSPQ